MIWEEKENQKKKKMKNEDLDKNDIMINTNRSCVKEKCDNIMKENYTKNCPKCESVQIYSNKNSLRVAKKHNSLCIKCDTIKKKSMVGEKNNFYGKSHTEETKNKIKYYRKNQPVITENGRRKISLIHKGNTYNLRRMLSDEVKEKMRNSHMGKNHGMYKCGENHFFYGKHHTEETKKRMGEVVIKRIQKYGVNNGRNFSLKACEFIDKLNKERGWNLKHALNGGEVELYGYFVDGYDEERNIIFEYDEKRHDLPYWKDKDIIRQNNLIKNINPIIFLRYNENKKELKYVCNFI